MSNMHYLITPIYSGNEGIEFYAAHITDIKSIEYYLIPQINLVMVCHSEVYIWYEKVWSPHAVEVGDK